MGDREQEKLGRYTVRVPETAPAREATDLVLVAPGADLGLGFARAIALTKEGRCARLVGHGVTLRATWPADLVPQLTNAPLLLTELGAYRGPISLEDCAELRSDLRAWVDGVFEAAAPKNGAAELYYAPVVQRLFQPVLDAHLIVRGIARLHPGVPVHPIDESWAALAELARLRGEGGTKDGRATRLLPLLLLALWAPACAMTLRECALAHRAARLSRDALAKRTDTAEPELWVGVVPDWFRMNKHLLDAVALPELRAKGKLGVLFVASLRAGMRDEASLWKSKDTTELWPGLGALRDELAHCTIGQAVQPTSLRGMARAMAAVIPASASVVLRMARRTEPLRRIAEKEGVRSVAKRAVSAATIDVARSILAERAAKAFTGKHMLEGKRVVLVAANSAGYTSVDRVLRDAGATTMEYLHGAIGGYWHGSTENSVSVRCLWTQIDRLQHAPSGQRSIVAGFPQNLGLAPRAIKAPRRVLLLSNYVHRDWSWGGRFPSEPFMHELLRVPSLLKKEIEGLEFRWRPHPADDEAAVRRGLDRGQQGVSIELSKGRPLAEDLDWCDVLVSGQSTALFEAIAADVPFFAQVTPEYEGDLSWIPRERWFYRADEVIAPFHAWAKKMAAGDPSANEASVRARESLFGPSGRPITFHEGIARLDGRSLNGRHDAGAGEPLPSARRP